MLIQVFLLLHKKPLQRLILRFLCVFGSRATHNLFMLVNRHLKQGTVDVEVTEKQLEKVKLCEGCITRAVIGAKRRRLTMYVHTTRVHSHSLRSSSNSHAIRRKSFTVSPPSVN